jgi:hypothetical protein
MVQSVEKLLELEAEDVCCSFVNLIESTLWRINSVGLEVRLLVSALISTAFRHGL